MASEHIPTPASVARDRAEEIIQALSGNPIDMRSWRPRDDWEPTKAERLRRLRFALDAAARLRRFRVKMGLPPV